MLLPYPFSLNQLNTKPDLHSSFTYSEKAIHMFIFKIHIQIYHWSNLNHLTVSERPNTYLQKTSPPSQSPVAPRTTFHPTCKLFQYDSIWHWCWDTTITVRWCFHYTHLFSKVYSWALKFTSCCSLACNSITGQTEENVWQFFSSKWDISNWFMLVEI